MKTIQIILGIALLGLISQTVSAQKVDDCLNENAILSIFHVKSSPHASRDEIVSFLNDEYFAVAESAYPGTILLHLEGIVGDRKGQHARFWIFPSADVRNSYFLDIETATDKYYTYTKKLDRKISQNKMVELFRGWDWRYNTNWRIVGLTKGKNPLTNLRGLELDVHHLSLDFDGDKKAVEQKLGELVNRVDSQFYILLGERDQRVGGYAILELHTPGHSHKSVFENAELPLEKGLFSSYRIW
jgi:hypothetical protein